MSGSLLLDRLAQVLRAQFILLYLERGVEGSRPTCGAGLLNALVDLSVSLSNRLLHLGRGVLASSRLLLATYLVIEETGPFRGELLDM